MITKQLTIDAEYETRIIFNNKSNQMTPSSSCTTLVEIQSTSAHNLVKLLNKLASVLIMSRFTKEVYLTAQMYGNSSIEDSTIKGEPTSRKYPAIMALYMPGVGLTLNFSKSLSMPYAPSNCIQDNTENTELDQLSHSFNIHIQILFPDKKRKLTSFDLTVIFIIILKVSQFGLIS